MLGRARLDAFRADVEALGDGAVDYCAGLMRAMRDENPGASVAELREAAIAAIEDSLSIFGDQAAALACDLFDALAADAGVEVSAGVYDLIDMDSVERRVRYSARKLVEGDADGFDLDVRDLTRYLIKREAFDNMLENCERNDLRYARVPSGRETCGFCLMLASRGFVYRSEAKARGSHGYHSHCDCVVVPGFEGLDQSGQIEGYDPDGMASRVDDCISTIGRTDGIREAWEKLSDEERARYKGKSESERFERFKTAQIAREIETRDWKWLHSGIQCEITRERGAKPWAKEKRAADLLSKAGFNIHFVRETNTGKMYDALLNGLTYEFKIPERYTEKTVKNQFKKGIGKGTSRLLISNIENGANRLDMAADIVKILSGDEFAEIGEVLFLDADGSTRRFLRK